MEEKIIERFETNHEDHTKDGWYAARYTGVYTKAENVLVSCGQWNLHITDLTNALKTGKTCTSWNIEFDNRAAVSCDEAPWKLINYAISKGTLTELLSFLRSVEFPVDDKWGTLCYRDTFEGHIVKIYKREKNGKRTFSPFNLGVVKPLTEIPKKWTLVHLKKALLNGQIDKIHCDGVYTDDYAFDAAYNYRQGEIENHIKFIKRIIESPSGWDVWPSNSDKNVVSVCCHSFDNNTVWINLENRKVPQF